MMIAFAAAAMLLAGCSEENTEAPVTPEVTDWIEVTGGEQEPLTAAGTEFTVTVKSSGDWRLTGRKEWCRPDVTEGAAGAEVHFTSTRTPATRPAAWSTPS